MLYSFAPHPFDKNKLCTKNGHHKCMHSMLVHTFVFLIYYSVSVGNSIEMTVFQLSSLIVYLSQVTEVVLDKSTVADTEVSFRRRHFERSFDMCN